MLNAAASSALSASTSPSACPPPTTTLAFAPDPSWERGEGARLGRTLQSEVGTLEDQRQAAMQAAEEKRQQVEQLEEALEAAQRAAEDERQHLSEQLAELEAAKAGRPPAWGRSTHHDTHSTSHTHHGTLM